MAIPKTNAFRAAAIATLLALAGCGHVLVQEDWDAAPTLPPLEPVYVEVAASELHELCRGSPGMYLYGCARRDYEVRACFIFTGPQPEKWLLDHERKHCAGFDHKELK